MLPFPLFHILGFPVFAYGLTAAFAFLTGYIVTHRLLVKDGLNAEILPDLAMWIIPGGLLGARILYILQHMESYASSPLSVFNIQEGGLVQFGGLAAGMLSGWLFCKKNKISFPRYSDAVAAGLSIGLALSRLGCLCAGCCYGRPTSMPWGVVFSHTLAAAMPKNVPLHPTQLYSLLLEMGIFFFIVSRKPSRPGNRLWLYLCLTAFARMFADLFRSSGQPPAQFMVLGGMAAFSILFLTVPQIKQGGIMKFKAVLKLTLVALAASALTACGIVTTQKVSRGLDISGSSVNSIVKNQTTEKDIIKLFGAPSKYRETADGKELFYEYAKSGGVRWNLLFSFGGGSEIKTLYVWLDKNGVVTDYAFKKS